MAFAPGGYVACVHEQPSGDVVAAAVGAIDERTSAQTSFMMAALVRGAWPGGVADRLETGALDWVRRWGPLGKTPDYVASLAAGGATAN
jgi:hypothetical protein